MKYLRTNLRRASYLGTFICMKLSILGAVYTALCGTAEEKLAPDMFLILSLIFY